MPVVVAGFGAVLVAPPPGDQASYQFGAERPPPP